MTAEEEEKPTDHIKNLSKKAKGMASIAGKGVMNMFGTASRRAAIQLGKASAAAKKAAESTRYYFRDGETDQDDSTMVRDDAEAEVKTEDKNAEKELKNIQTKIQENLDKTKQNINKKIQTIYEKKIGDSPFDPLKNALLNTGQSVNDAAGMLYSSAINAGFDLINKPCSGTKYTWHPLCIGAKTAAYAYDNAKSAGNTIQTKLLLDRLKKYSENNAEDKEDVKTAIETITNHLNASGGGKKVKKKAIKTKRHRSKKTRKTKKAIKTKRYREKKQRTKHKRHNHKRH